MRSRQRNKLSHARPFSIACALLAASIAQSGCGDSDEFRRANASDVILIDRTTQNLLVGDLEHLSGKYGPGCYEKEGKNWSATIGTPASPRPYPPLSVPVNYVDCKLTLHEVRSSRGDWVTLTPIALGDGFPDLAGVPFGPAPTGMPTVFYAKTKLTKDSNGNFVVSFAFSNDPVFAPDLPPRQPNPGMSSPDAVASPDYKLEVGTLAYVTNEEGVIVTVQGAATLTPGLVTGEDYVLFDGEVERTFAAIDAAYRAGTATPIDQPITGAAIAPLVSGDEPAEKAPLVSIIVGNLDETTGIRSYQVLTLQIGST